MTIPIPPYTIPPRTNTIASITHQDSNTHLFILEELRAYLDRLIPMLNDALRNQDAFFAEQVQALIVKVNDAISTAVTGVASDISGLRTEVQEWISTTVANGDAVTATALNDPNSQIRAALRGMGMVRGEAPKGVRLIGGALRNNGGPDFWQLIEDSSHVPFGIESVTTTPEEIIMSTTSQIGAIAGGTVVAVTDETMAKDGYFVGCSGGGYETRIQIGRRKTIADRVWYDVATSKWMSESGVFTFPTTPMDASGVLTVNHEQMLGTDGVSLVGHSHFSNPVRYPTVALAYAQSTTIRFYDAAGAIKTVPDAGMRFYLVRTDDIPLGGVNAQTFLDIGQKPFHNIWFFGAQALV